MAERTRVSITLSPSMRRRVEEARETSGRTLSEEIEARLRRDFRQPDGDNLLLLRMDDGLQSWLRAFVAGPGFFGDLNQTAIYLIRAHLNEMLRHDVWFSGTVPHLPEPIRSHVADCPKYRALLRAEGDA